MIILGIQKSVFLKTGLVVAGTSKVFCGTENGVCELTKDTVYVHPSDKQCSWEPINVSPFMLLQTGTASDSSSPSFAFDFNSKNYNMFLITGHITATDDYAAPDTSSNTYNTWIRVYILENTTNSQSTIRNSPLAFNIPMGIRDGQSTNSSSNILIYVFKNIKYDGVPYLHFQNTYEYYTETEIPSMYYISGYSKYFYIDGYSSARDISFSYKIYGIT